MNLNADTTTQEKSARRESMLSKSCKGDSRRNLFQSWPSLKPAGLNYSSP